MRGFLNKISLFSVGNLSALPFDLHHHDVRNVSHVLTCDPTLAPSMNILLTNFVAKNTYKSYRAVIKVFKQFMDVNSQNLYYYFNEEDILRFVATCVPKERQHSFF